MIDYVVVKLTTGETLLAILAAQDEEKIELFHPLVVKAIQVQREGKLYEQTVTNAYCPFTEDQDFVFENADVLFVKPMHSKIIPFYQVMVGMSSVKDDLESLYADPPGEEEGNKVFH